MNLEAINHLVKSGETVTLEFKKSTANLTKKITKYWNQRIIKNRIKKEKKYVITVTKKKWNK